MVLHFAVPAAIAATAYRKRFFSALAIMIAALAIDLDHLVAEPIYDPDRCSIGFHPLHTYPAIAAYVLLLFFPKTRLIGLGLAVHIALDAIDCGWMHLAP